MNHDNQLAFENKIKNLLIESNYIEFIKKQKENIINLILTLNYFLENKWFVYENCIYITQQNKYIKTESISNKIKYNNFRIYTTSKNKTYILNIENKERNYKNNQLCSECKIGQLHNMFYDIKIKNLFILALPIFKCTHCNKIFNTPIANYEIKKSLET